MSDKYDELILEELKDIKNEFVSIRKEMINSANLCGEKHTKLVSTFISNVTFWKIISIILFLIFGNYTYATLIYKLSIT